MCMTQTDSGNSRRVGYKLYFGLYETHQHAYHAGLQLVCPKPRCIWYTCTYELV